MRFRIEYQLGDLICFVGYAQDLYVASARMATYDPEGIFDLRVVDTETEEIIPNILMAMAGLHVRRRLIDKKVKVNWAREGF